MFFWKRNKEKCVNADAENKEKEQFLNEAQSYVIMQLIDEFADNLAPFGYVKEEINAMFLKRNAPDLYVREPEDERNTFTDKVVIISFRCKTRRHAPQELLDYVRILNTQSTGNERANVLVPVALKNIQYNLLVNLWNVEKNEKNLKVLVKNFWTQAMTPYLSKAECNQMIKYIFLSCECFDDTIELLKNAETIQF